MTTVTSGHALPISRSHAPNRLSITARATVRQVAHVASQFVRLPAALLTKAGYGLSRSLLFCATAPHWLANKVREMSPAKRALTLALGSAAVLGVQTAIAKIMDWSMEGGGGVVPMAFGIASQVGKGKAAYSPISREEIAAAFPQVAQALIGLSRLALWGSGNALAYPRQDSFYDHNTNVDCGDMRVVERPFPNIPLGLAIHISWQIPSTEVADMALKYMQRLNYKMLSAVEAAVRLPGTEPEVSPDFSNAERDSIVAALLHPRSVVLELVNKAMEKIDRSKIKTPQDLVPALDKVINQLFYDLEGVTDSLKYAGLILEIYDIILKRRSEAQVQNPEVDEHW